MKKVYVTPFSTPLNCHLFKSIKNERQDKPKIYRIAFVEQSKFPVRSCRIVRIEEYPAGHQGPVEVGDERPDIPGRHIRRLTNLHLQKYSFFKTS